MVKNNYNVKLDDRGKEFISSHTDTEPGQSYSVRDLLIRFKQGLPMPSSVGFYYDTIFEEEVNPLRSPNLDLTDIEAAKKFVQEQTDKYVFEKVTNTKMKGNGLENVDKNRDYDINSNSPGHPAEGGK